MVSPTDKLYLSDNQRRALAKLTNDWQSAYALGESRATLNALVKRGFALHKQKLGASFRGMDTVMNEYKLA